VSHVDRPFEILSICSGTAAGDLAIRLAVPSARTRVYVEREAYAIATLVRACEEGSLASAHCWTDVKTFDGLPFRGLIDCIVATYPCQPFSAAGKRRGTEDERHLWPHIARIVGEVQPALVFIENVRNHLRIGFEGVCRDLWEMGYETRAGLFSAAEIGAPHQRVRLFALAYRNGKSGYIQRCERHSGQSTFTGSDRELAYSPGARLPHGRASEQAQHGAEAQEGVDDRSQHSSGDVEHAEHSDWRQERGRGDGGEPWRDGEGQTSGGPGERGAALDDPEGDGRREGWPESAGIEGGLDASQSSGAVGHAERTGLEGRAGERGDVHEERAAAERAGAAVAAPYLFPPARTGDWDRWSDVLVRQPWLRPSISQAEAEPAVLGVADGLAAALGKHRAHKLRCIGNGIVPACMAHAFITLAVEHGIGTIGPDGSFQFTNGREA